jgi:hypothetical protein
VACAGDAISCAGEELACAMVRGDDREAVLVWRGFLARITHAYDAHLPAHKEAGFIKEVHLLRNADDPNETITMFEVESLQKARGFSASSDLREAMQKSGVVDKPDIYFLE